VEPALLLYPMFRKEVFEGFIHDGGFGVPTFFPPFAPT